MSFFLAGLATGLGKGMVDQAQFNLQRDEAARDRDFQMALENLRTQNDMNLAVKQGEIADTNTRKEYGYKDEFEERDLPRKIKLAETDGAIRKDIDNNATANDIRREQVRGAIARQNDEAAMKLRDQLESGQIVDTLLDESGEYVGITRNGKQVRTGVYGHTVDTTFRPYAGSGGYGGSALFPELEPQGLGAAAAPAQPAPAAQGQRQQQAPAGQRTMTQEDIQATAEARGISPAAAKMLLEQLGFKLVR